MNKGPLRRDRGGNGMTKYQPQTYKLFPKSPIHPIYPLPLLNRIFQYIRKVFSHPTPLNDGGPKWVFKSIDRVASVFAFKMIPLVCLESVAKPLALV